MLFLARRWSGDPRPDGVETTEMLWADPAAPPSPLDEPSAHALDLYRAYLRDRRLPGQLSGALASRSAPSA